MHLSSNLIKYSEEHSEENLALGLIFQTHISTRYGNFIIQLLEDELSILKDLILKTMDKRKYCLIFLGKVFEGTILRSVTIFSGNK